MLTNITIISIVAIQTLVPIWATIRVMKRDDYSAQTKNLRVVAAWMIPFSAVVILIVTYFDKPQQRRKNKRFK